MSVIGVTFLTRVLPIWIRSISAKWAIPSAIFWHTSRRGVGGRPSAKEAELRGSFRMHCNELKDMYGDADIVLEGNL